MIEKTIVTIIVLVCTILILGVGYILGRIHEKSLRSNKYKNPYIDSGRI